MHDSRLKKTESLASLLTYIKAQQDDLVRIQETFDRVSAWFKEGCAINQERQKFILESISSLRKPVEALCTVVEAKSQQEILLPIRYPLADALYQFQEKIDEVLFLLMALHIPRHGFVKKRKSRGDPYKSACTDASA